MVLSGRPGLASSGAVVGVLVAAFLYHVVRRIAWTRLVLLLDVLAFASPFAAALGRLGCTLAHDHRGRHWEGWLAVRFPEGPRYDLGLIDFFFLTALSVTFFLFDRKSHAPGFFFGLAVLAYGLSACGAKHWTYRRTSFRG